MKTGQRFEFGKNWQRFLSVLDEEGIAEAVRSLEQALGDGGLAGKSYLDAGSGSGLFSLAAVRLGASRVHSFDFDPASVACTREVKRRYSSEAEHWTIEPGDALDEAYVNSLGKWDVVYSWGVLHHTGDMRRALTNVSRAVAPGGRLFISIYNDQGARSRMWRQVKRVYNSLPAPLRPPFVALVMLPRELPLVGSYAARRNPLGYCRVWSDYKLSSRGMSRWRDFVDWVGGYPFEVARPEEIFYFFHERGFTLTGLKTCAGGIGCNEYVFRNAP